MFNILLEEHKFIFILKQESKGEKEPKKIKTEANNSTFPAGSRTIKTTEPQCSTNELPPFNDKSSTKIQ